MDNPDKEQPHEKFTENPVDIEQLTWLTTKQACIYLKMYPEAFRKLVADHDIPFRSTAPNRERGRRIYRRALLDQAMDADMKRTGLTGAGEQRIATILGEQA